MHSFIIFIPLKLEHGKEQKTKSNSSMKLF